MMGRFISPGMEHMQHPSDASAPTAIDPVCGMTVNL